MMIAIDKSYIENRIAELTKHLRLSAKERTENGKRTFINLSAKISVYEDILSQSIEIPVEESWDIRLGLLDSPTGKPYIIPAYVTEWLKENYPNGVIIKSK